MSTDLWLALGTSIGTFVFLVAPVLVYGHFALESWIDDPKSYGRVIAAVESAEKRTPGAR